MRENGLHPIAQSVVNAYFLDSAEEDYLVARWAAQNARLHQFCWSAAQTIEKSLKAITLNCRIPLSRKGDGHQFTVLLSKLIEDGRLPSESLKVQTSLPSEKIYSSKFTDGLRPTPIEEVVYRFQENGTAHIRYRNAQVTKAFFNEVHMLDALFILLRELAGRPARKNLLESQEPDEAGTLEETFAAEFPSLDGPSNRNRLQLATTISFQNIEFFPKYFSHDHPLIGGFSVRKNPWPIRRSNAALFGDDEAKTDLDWLLSNAKVHVKEEAALRELADHFLTRAKKE
ncbi:MAG TPA: hypothetical protein EYQ36_02485 [Sulfitobacter sp.]|nr:hypothetical protein [Sulfitobacter sp.]